MPRGSDAEFAADVIELVVEVKAPAALFITE
jgi:hypothetical protein